MVKERGALRRRRARASRGFTLLEMMVVVMLVSILALIAVPTMSQARNDRIAFDFARQAQEQFHNARARSAGRGAAHLTIFTTQSSFGARGGVYVFQALDGGATPPGPNPSSTCRSASQWAWTSTFTPGASQFGELVDANHRTILIDGMTANATSGSIVTSEDISMTAKLTVLPDDPTAAAGTPTVVTAFVMCTTPNGTTFVGTGTTVSAAITAMAASTESFKDLLEIDVSRHVGGSVVGVTRRVLLSGAMAPRMKSE